MLGLFDNFPRLRRFAQTTMLVIGVIGVCGFGLRIAQQAGIVTINLDTDQKTADCVLLEQAFEAARVDALEFIMAGCPSARLREVLVRRVQGGQQTVQHRMP